MKTCPYCKENKLLSEFGSDKGKKDGLTSRCKTCKRLQERSLYQNQLSGRKEACKKRKLRIVRENQDNLYEYLEKKQCLDCGEKDIVLLDFDHINDNKVMEVSKMLRSGYSWQTIKKEMNKCEVVCANCHRIRTAKRAGWRIYNYSRGEIWNQEDS